MVKYSQNRFSSQLDEQMNLLFYSLSDPTRRGILERLASSQLSVTQIAEPYDMSLPAISKHLKVLENANLIIRQKHGRSYHISLEPKTLKAGVEYMSFYQKFWSNRLDKLEKLFQKVSHAQT